VGVGDSVAVLVTSKARSRRQLVDCSQTPGASGTAVAYFRVVGFASRDGGHPFSIVNPYGPADDEGCRVLRHRRFQYMPLVASARLAWVVHDCDECKPNENRRMTHSAANRWVILQRPRSGRVSAVVCVVGLKCRADGSRGLCWCSTCSQWCA